MKKLLYIAAIAFAASMVACSGEKKAEATEEAAEPVAAEVVEVAAACDSCACDTCPCDSCVAAEVVEVAEAAQ